MKGNFDFLKTVNKDLYEIINDAEKLYRDRYFEQCMTQTRRFGEIVCKNVLGSKRTTEITFDAMLATLKDCTLGGSVAEKEFIDDLYFLKKHGNDATHSFKVKQDGMEALECLKRAFEVGINYCAYKVSSKKDILKLQYDTELLITGKESKKTLAEEYQEAKAKSTKVKTKKISSKKQKQYCSVKSQKRDKKPIFWYFVGISAIVSVMLVVLLLLI